MLIDSYHFGRIVVEGQPYSADLILLPERVEANWWRRSGHELHPDDLTTVLEARPKTLVVGTGMWGRMRILPETEHLLREKGIHLIALETGKAVETYNRLRQEDLAVAGAFHLTC